MKKKIKDVTIGEAIKTCRENPCPICNLNIHHKPSSRKCIFSILLHMDMCDILGIIEQEVDV